MKTINPKSLGRPRGYSNGQLTAPDARLLFIAGQIGWDEEQRLVSDDFVEQFERALRNLLAVVLEAGGAPGGVARLVVYVTDKREYAARTRRDRRALARAHGPTLPRHDARRSKVPARRRREGRDRGHRRTLSARGGVRSFEVMFTRVALSLIRAASVSLVCASAAACALPGLLSGPKDTGGVYMILVVKADGEAVEQSVNQAAQVILSRCDALGVYCKVERQGGEGSNRFKLRVSGAQDFPRVKAVLLMEGKLELKPVVSAANPAPMQTYPTRAAAEREARPDSEVVGYGERGGVSEYLLVEREPVISGLDIRDARAEAGYEGGIGDNYSIAFTLKPGAVNRFGEWTDKNVGRYLAIVLNGEVRSAPYIKSRITDSGQITGSFTKQQAEDVALTLNSGKLPTAIEVLEERQYKP